MPAGTHMYIDYFVGSKLLAKQIATIAELIMEEGQSIVRPDHVGHRLDARA